MRWATLFGFVARAIGDHDRPGRGVIIQKLDQTRDRGEEGVVGHVAFDGVEELLVQGREILRPAVIADVMDPGIVLDLELGGPAPHVTPALRRRDLDGVASIEVRFVAISYR